MPSRRDFLRLAALGALLPQAARAQPKGKPKPKPKPGAEPEGVFVNDVHSGLTATMVSQILVPGTVDEVRAALKLARSEERSICIAGSRHAMGQQAFATDAILLDTRKLTRVLGFDAGRGLIEFACNWSRLHGAKQLKVGVFDDNRGALAFYRSAGFNDGGITRPELSTENRTVLLLTMNLSRTAGTEG